MGVGPAGVVDLGDGAENAGGAVRPERNTVGLPNAPNGLSRVMTMAVPPRGRRGGRGCRAVEEREHPLALRIAELVELLVQYHAVYLGSVSVCLRVDSIFRIGCAKRGCGEGRR